MNKIEQLPQGGLGEDGRLPNDPPLRAVRVFEAIARLGSITAAARELNISPSAVSHQLKTLETFLQMPLTERQGRRLMLRNEGREYYRSIRSAFTVLRQATEHVLEHAQSRQVTISLIPLFGMGWFIPRLPDFLRANPQTDINVVYANHRNYLSDASDMSIRFGGGQWGGYRSEKLVSGRMVPVCSREFLRIHGHIDEPEQLLQLPLLHDEERSTWMQWFQAQNVRRPPRSTGPLFEDGLLTLAGLQAGLGCALMREPLIERFLHGGELVKLFDLPIEDGRDYHLCVRQDIEMSADGKLLQRWLQEQAGVSG
ncbi:MULTISPECIES: LysR substrate-binding domain-containing protein [Brenneria]|uniref:LysR family transcriptional regulator n=1 Tax=Brenneria nigrifluens DSM 30175 = ATCC 13028 TaxID=1121120 RepID=A0A2U1UW76_9GAMM|nr:MULTISPECIES: LysR substrate-binding domain-containing protein [Brenneria]EHD22729.1 transcriptional regulator, LysR family [Brenneria sp. EniD312]PWC25907.1 LysR family transcriptional regulator [Brenneria nigrifluens DSM 30175 = ATCC 13028]QCR05706.1 LysR family transcriptional regulator [Brenneria nigrifluens DSM 30175 = ATCC 13028]